MIASLRFLVDHVWPMLAAGSGLGLLVGVTTCSVHSAKLGSRLALVFWAGLVAAGVTASALGWLAGRYGLWLDIAVLLLCAYVVGCLGGCAIRRLVRRSAPPSGTPAAPA